MSATEGVSVENLTFQTSKMKTEPGFTDERAKNKAHILGQTDAPSTCEQLDLSEAPLTAAAKITKQHRIAGASPVRNTVVQGVSNTTVSSFKRTTNL